MNILKNVSSNNSMEVSVHEIKHQINVSIVFSPYNVLKSNDVFMPIQFLKENDLSESSLSISGILKGVKVFLKSHYFLRLLVYSLPNYTIRSFA